MPQKKLKGKDLPLNKASSTDFIFYETLKKQTIHFL